MADEIQVKVLDDGPYLLDGTMKIVDADGNELASKGSNIALCRCGSSGNKPFCDGSHRGAGFDSKPRA